MLNAITRDFVIAFMFETKMTNNKIVITSIFVSNFKKIYVNLIVWYEHPMIIIIMNTYFIDNLRINFLQFTLNFDISNSKWT